MTTPQSIPRSIEKKASCVFSISLSCSAVAPSIRLLLLLRLGDPLSLLALTLVRDLEFDLILDSRSHAICPAWTLGTHSVHCFCLLPYTFDISDYLYRLQTSTLSEFKQTRPAKPTPDDPWSMIPSRNNSYENGKILEPTLLSRQH